MYIILYNGHPCIKQDLDKYLSNKEVNKDKRQLSQDEWIVLFLKYCTDGKVPPCREIYQGHNLGNWYFNQKRKITNTESEVYKTVCECHPCIKQDLDRYLSKKTKV